MEINKAKEDTKVCQTINYMVLVILESEGVLLDKIALTRLHSLH